jgi:zinc carboxypeptidase
MPPAPPDRPNAAAFHYHTYSYPQDDARGAFQLSDALASAGDARFYSLSRDLLGLVAWGNTRNVPNLRLTSMSTQTGGTQTVGGREMLVLSFGGPPPGPSAPLRPAVVFTGGIHAREWIAVAYLVAEYLIKNYTTTPQNRYQRMIRALVDNRRIYVIPMLSADYKMLGMALWSLVHGQGVTDYLLGTPRELLDADATGTVMERAAQQHQSRAFTIELDPPLTVENGWLLAEDQICGVFEKNIRGALAAIASPPNTASLAYAKYVYDLIVKVFTTWNVYGRGNQLPA